MVVRSARGMREEPKPRRILHPQDRGFRRPISLANEGGQGLDPVRAEREADVIATAVTIAPVPQRRVALVVLVTGPKCGITIRSLGRKLVERAETGVVEVVIRFKHDVP